ncbi:MAG: hypothetical protein LUD02_08335 [Tannerellaceae bacterium]|nr:hypothetical protein [Tannerellaceae bacterium]
MLTLNATAGNTEDLGGNFGITLRFGTMEAPIAVSQAGETTEYVNLSSYEMLTFSEISGEESEEITVSSSVDWVAEIAYGDHFSFSVDGLETILEGEPEEGFIIYTLQDNLQTEAQYCFVKIYLADHPNVSRVVVLKQEAWDGKYLTLSPTSVASIPAQGGVSEVITIDANGPWTASIIAQGNDAWFGDGETQSTEISGDGNYSFTVYFPKLTQENISPWAQVTVKLENSSKQTGITVSQLPIAEYGLLIWTNTLGVSTLALYGTDVCATSGSTSTNKKNMAHHTEYVYDLSNFMRDKQLFGSYADSEVYVEGGFRFVQGGVDTRNAASIWQFTSYPAKNSAEMNAIKQAMAEDGGKFLIFSHKDAAVSTTLSNFGMNSGYTVSSITATNAKKGYVFVNTAADIDKPLLKYLTETGPFTKGNSLNTANIQIYGPGAAVRGFTKWPATFTPILVNSGTGACVFGVDLVQRFVWMSDPGIFGCEQSGALNYGNYVESKEENVLLIKNFIAFLAEAIQKKEAFLDDFR